MSSGLNDMNSMLYIREVYDEFVHLVENEKKAIVRGNPGIGKSYFGIYLLYLAVGCYPVMYFRNHSFHYFQPGKEVVEIDVTCQSREETKIIKTALNNPDCLYIFDCLTHQKMDMYFDKKSRLVVLTSPSRDNYVEVEKLNNSTLFTMPPWSLEEIQVSSNKCGLPASTVLERFRDFGGIPRYVFATESKVEDHIARRMGKIKSCTGESLLRVQDETLCEKESNLIFHMNSDKDNRRAYYVTFASPETANQVYVAVEQDCKGGCLQFLKRAVTFSFLSGFSSKFHEILGHNMIVSGEEFAVRELTGVKNKSSTGRFKLQGYNHSFFLEWSEVDVNEKRYWVPKKINFPTVDSFAVVDNKIYGFQMTIQPTHSMEASGFKLLYDHFKIKEVHIYTVVPGEIYRSRYQKKKELTLPSTLPITVRQFALCLDYST